MKGTYLNFAIQSFYVWWHSEMYPNTRVDSELNHWSSHSCPATVIMCSAFAILERFLYFFHSLVGFYMYVNGETSGDDDKAVLVTNQVYARPSFFGFCMSFNYYMYGTNVGDITLYYTDETTGIRHNVILFLFMYFLFMVTFIHTEFNVTFNCSCTPQ